MPRPIDPSGFSLVVQLRFQDQSGGENVVPLWTRGSRGATSGSRASLFFGDEYLDVPIVGGVTVNMGLGMDSEISVPIAAPLDLGLALLNSVVVQIGNRLEIQLSYPKLGLSTPWFTGLTIRPDFEIGEDGFSATLKAVGVAYAGHRTAGDTLWNDTSYEAILREIASRQYNQWTLDVPARDGADDPLYLDRQSVSQQMLSDWVFVNQIGRFSGCDLALVWEQSGEAVLRVRRRASEFAAAPRYTFQFRGQIDMVSRFPILNFAAEGEMVSLPRGGARVVWDDIDPVTGENRGGVVTQDDRQAVVQRLNSSSVQPGAESGGAALLPGDSGERLAVPVASQAESPDEVAASRSDEAAVRGGFAATLTTIGIPDLLPGEMVRVVGLGDMFGGNYLVTNMTHEASDFWTMELKLLSNAQGGEQAIAEIVRSQYEDFNAREGAPQADPDSGASVDVDAEPA